MYKKLVIRTSILLYGVDIIYLLLLMDAGSGLLFLTLACVCVCVPESRPLVEGNLVDGRDVGEGVDEVHSCWSDLLFFLCSPVGQNINDKRLRERTKRSYCLPRWVSSIMYQMGQNGLQKKTPSPPRLQSARLRFNNHIPSLPMPSRPGPAPVPVPVCSYQCKNVRCTQPTPGPGSFISNVRSLHPFYIDQARKYRHSRSGQVCLILPEHALFPENTQAAIPGASTAISFKLGCEGTQSSLAYCIPCLRYKCMCTNSIALTLQGS
jgi:hypothetical protein